MKIIRFLSLVILTAISVSSYAEQNKSVSGYIKDAANGEALVGASVYCLATQQGISADAYGYFSLQLGAGADTLRVSFIGYADTALPVASLGGIVSVQLAAGRSLQEVSVTAQHTAAAPERITAKTVTRLPVVMGESDITRTVLMMPGVAAGNESTAG